MSHDNTPILIVFSGLPATGKTTLAKMLSEKIDAFYLRIDTIENALRQSVLRVQNAEDAGYVAACAIASENLMLGKSIIADAVNPIQISRDAWRDVAGKTGAALVEIEIICSDALEHRSRAETRQTDLQGHQNPNWDQIIARNYEPWDRQPIVVDTAGQTPTASLNTLMNLAALVDTLRHTTDAKQN